MPVRESPYHPAKKPLWARDKGFSACRKSLFRRTRHCFIQMRDTQYAGIQVIVSACQNQRVRRQTACCLHSPISSTVLRLLSVCQRHIRSISFHPSSFESPYPVLHLSRRRMRYVRSLAEKKRRIDGRMAVWYHERFWGWLKASGWTEIQTTVSRI